MKRIKTTTHILIIGLFCLGSMQLFAQNNKLKDLDQKAYTAYINSSIFMWKQIVIEADKILSEPSSPQQNKIKAISHKYGLLYACLSNQDKETYESYLDKTIEQIDNLLEENPNSSQLYAISAALMSVQMGFSPMKGMTLGSKSGAYIDKSIKLDESNPCAWRQHASSKYFTPEMFGGDIDVAIESYEHSVSLFEENNEINNWMYLDALAWLGIAYQKKEQIEKAKKVFEKALEVEPSFMWVKNHLIPNLK